MKHYLHSVTQLVHAFEVDGSQDYLITSDMTLLTQAELDARNAPPPAYVPQSVTPLQASRALLAFGMLDTVEAAVAAADRETQLAWNKATSIERNSPFVASMAAVLPLTDAQLDDLFILAATFV